MSATPIGRNLTICLVVVTASHLDIVIVFAVEVVVVYTNCCAVSLFTVVQLCVLLCVVSMCTTG
jgi:hypothetical protein